ncbi:CopD family protein [Blastococcus sp. SYSU D00868]
MTALLPRPAPAAEGTTPARRPPLGLLGAGALGLGAVLVLALVAGGAAPAGAAPGLSGPGALVDWGLPVATLAVRVAALGTVGTLLFAAVLLPGPVLPGPGGGGGGGGRRGGGGGGGGGVGGGAGAGFARVAGAHGDGAFRPGRERHDHQPGGQGGGPPGAPRAARAASRWASAWAVAVVAEAALELSRLVGVPPWRLTGDSVHVFLLQLPAGDAAFGAGTAAVAVAVGARRSAGSGAAVLLLLVAGAGVVLPTVLTGHSAAAEDHLLTTATLAVHVLAACVWVGGLLAVLVHGRGPDLPRVAARFSAVALVAAAAVGASGLLAAGLVLDEGAGLLPGLASGYGLLLAGKTAALVALLAFGRHHRRRTLPRLAAGRPGDFRRFAAVETAVMLATVALAVALSASPPPAAAGPGGAAAEGAAGAATPPAAAGAEAQGGSTPPPGHDHGDLSVPVLVDPTGVTVTGSVAPGAVVTVHNPTDADVTLTADDGSFDARIPAGSLTSFRAPDRPGSYPFTSRHAPGSSGVLVVS